MELKCVSIFAVPECLVRIKSRTCQSDSTLRYIECLAVPVEDFEFPPNITFLRISCKARYKIVPESLLGNVDIVPDYLCFSSLIDP